MLYLYQRSNKLILDAQTLPKSQIQRIRLKWNKILATQLRSEIIQWNTSTDGSYLLLASNYNNLLVFPFFKILWFH